METQFTKDETALLQLYASLKNTPKHFANRLAVEAIPPFLFLITYFITDHILYLIALIFALTFFNLNRVIKQQKSIKQLRSIATKALKITHENMHQNHS